MTHTAKNMISKIIWFYVNCKYRLHNFGFLRRRRRLIFFCFMLHESDFNFFWIIKCQSMHKIVGIRILYPADIIFLFFLGIVLITCVCDALMQLRRYPLMLRCILNGVFMFILRIVNLIWLCELCFLLNAFE